MEQQSADMQNREQDIRSLITEYYRAHMWLEDPLYERALEQAAAENWTAREFYQLAEKARPGLIEKQLNAIRRLGNQMPYYYCPKKVFKVGEESELIIRTKYRYQRMTGIYQVVISPYYQYDYRTDIPFAPFTAKVEARENKITLSCRFPAEDMYQVSVFLVMENRSELLLHTNVYAVEEDLYTLNYYKADLHMHTIYSDGWEPPELVALSARKAGMDIIAITDHNNFNDSVKGRKAAEELGLDLTVILGEEYSLEYSPMHILSLGTQEAIDRKFLQKSSASSERVQEIMREAGGLHSDPVAYACTQALLDEVRRMGGVSILAHPYWKPIYHNGSRIDTPEGLFLDLSGDRRFDGIELVSGSMDGECAVGNLQYALAKEMVGSFDGIPVIGITDSHAYSIDPISGRHFTVIFARDKSPEAVLDALRSGFSAAVEKVGSDCLVYGSFRLIKFTRYLVRHYFPERDLRAQADSMAALEKMIRKD